MRHARENVPDVKTKIAGRLSNFGTSYSEAKYTMQRENMWIRSSHV